MVKRVLYMVKPEKLKKDLRMKGIKYYLIKIIILFGLLSVMVVHILQHQMKKVM